MKTKTRLFSFYIFVDLFRKVRKIADKESLSNSSVSNKALREYLDRG